MSQICDLDTLYTGVESSTQECMSQICDLDTLYTGVDRSRQEYTVVHRSA